jgi:hypothetical protein
MLRRYEQMKFLIIMKPREALAPHATTPVLQSAQEWLDARMADKTFDCLYTFTTGGGVAIANVDTTEQLMKLLYDFPQFGTMLTEVLPLTDYKEAYRTFMAHHEKFAEYPHHYTPPVATAPGIHN